MEKRTNFVHNNIFYLYFHIFFNLKISNLMNKFAEVKDLVMSLEGDFEKFYDKGNQAAGTRVRKGMQDLKTLAQNIRSEVQNMKNEG